MTTDFMREILKAYDNGEQIQQRDMRFPESEWEDIDCPDWNFSIYDYRVRPTLMTYRQLAEWYAKGFGELKKGDSIYPYVDRYYSAEDHIVSGEWEIRYWQTKEWLKPTVEIYRRDCLKEEDNDNS